MASKVLQLNKIDRRLGAVALIFFDVADQRDANIVYVTAAEYLVPGYRGKLEQAFNAAGCTVTLNGQFSADVERHDVLWEMLERMPQVSCLVIYTGLPDHSFEFGPREL